MNKINMKNIWLIIRTLLFVMLIIIIKMILHYFKFELITINNLFSGIIAANVFLMGFLLSGVLSDYKESEKIPGDIASIISSIYDEVLNVYESKNDKNAKRGMKIVCDLALNVEKWLHKKKKTRLLLVEFRSLDKVFNDLEKILQPNFIVRLKNEVASLKKLIIRTDTIRDTNFITSGYIIAGITTFLMCLGLILSKIEPFYESLFFVGVISFLMIFLLLLIHDLDNPFGYNDKYSAENISLHPIHRLIEEMKETNKGLGIK
jgi:predicted membrane chloride channel (bestrophin family)